jgi:hypothetical protein
MVSVNEKTDRHVHLSDRLLAVCAILARVYEKRRKESDLRVDPTGSIDATIRITGTLLQNDDVEYIRKNVDKDELIRVLLLNMTPEQKRSAKDRLNDPKARPLQTKIDEWFDLVTERIESVRSGALVGSLKIDPIEVKESTIEDRDLARELASEV